MTGDVAPQVAWLAGPAAAVVACGLATFLLAGRAQPRTTAALGLLTVLAAFFLVFVLLVPAAPGGQLLPTALFFGSLAVFKLMSRFESR